MMRIFWKDIFILTLALFFLAETTGFCYTALPMSEVRQMFQQEKGKVWEDATAEEQKGFLRDIREREKAEKMEIGEWKKKFYWAGAEVVSQDAVLEGKERAPFDVRTAFERDQGKKWEDATKKERKVYWKRFKKSEKEWEKREKLRLKKERARLREAEKKRELEEKELERTRKARILKKEKKRREIEKKRKEARRALEEAKRKAEQARKKFQARRRN